MNKFKKKQAFIIGAGPAGLTAGCELAKNHNWTVTIVDEETLVGGLSKTTEYKGCRFDVGPHHFITDNKHILQWWKSIMGDDFIKLKRFTRIYYKKRFFHYPLQPLNAIKNLSFIECVQCVSSYAWAILFPKRKVVSIRDFFVNRFGNRLFLMFFKNYTEKLWGIPCDKISADWSAQRIRNFSLFKAIFFAFFGRFFKRYAPRTIQDEFYYPSLGAGTLWERVALAIRAHEGNSVVLGETVVALGHDNKKIIAVTTNIGTRYLADYFFSTMTLSDLVHALDPIAPAHVLAAAKALRCRHLITINLIVNKSDICPDHWLYIHEPNVEHIRMGNMNNFSISMVDNPAHSALSFEYFVFAGDQLWNKPDTELIALGKREIDILGLAKESDVLGGMVIRALDAYPIYEENYKEHLHIVRSYLDGFENLQLIGRNGTHSYNNMDAAMLSAMEAVERVVLSAKQPVQSEPPWTKTNFLPPHPSRKML